MCWHFGVGTPPSTWVTELILLPLVARISMITKTGSYEELVRYQEPRNFNSPLPTSTSIEVAFTLFTPFLVACSFTTSFSPFLFFSSFSSFLFSDSISFTLMCASRSELRDRCCTLESWVVRVGDIRGMGSWIGTRRRSSWAARSKWV